MVILNILFSKNGYIKHLITLSSSDGFAIRWFFDELVVRYSLSKSNLSEKRFKSNETEYFGQEPVLDNNKKNAVDNGNNLNKGDKNKEDKNDDKEKENEIEAIFEER